MEESKAIGNARKPSYVSGMEKTGLNESYPCGSGKKYKKCCQTKGVGTRHTCEDRANAWAKLERLIESELGEVDDDALELTRTAR